MAHNIWNDKTRQQDAMFVVGNREAAWHLLGQRTPNAVNWKQAMKLAGLDWEVILRPTFARQPNKPHTVVELPTKAVFRSLDNAVLGVVGADYTPIQNEKAFDFVDALLEAENGAHYESAGALGNGERIWCMARIPKGDFKVGGVDPHQTYLLFTTAHDGTMSAVCKLTEVRVVCNNTLTQALSSSGVGARFRHTLNALARMDTAKRLMTGAVQDAAALGEKLNTLAQRKLTRATLIETLDRLFPKPAPTASSTRRENTLTEILGLFESNDKNQFPQFRGTAYNLLNAVTEWTDHTRSARISGTRATAGYTMAKARAENAIFGTGDALKSNALDTILEVTAGKPAKGRAAVAVMDAPDVDDAQQAKIDSIVDRILRT